MSDLTFIVNSLHRPRLLIAAARHGVRDYNRLRVLKRLTRSPSVPTPKKAVQSLLSVEATLENARKERDATYNVARHVEVMIALLAEARLLTQPKATH